MKRILAFFIVSGILLFSSCVFAQDIAKIVDLKGDVSVQKTASGNWQKAKVNMVLNKDAQVKTGKKSFCTLAFDEELKNVMTIKENSQVKIENIKPVKVFLPEGRVFSLINALGKIEKFEVRTPTAIAGARGTGLGVGFSNGSTSGSCFEHSMYVIGLDNQGNSTGQEDVNSGSGLNVGPGGVIGSLFGLGPDAWAEWNEFRSYIDGLRKGTGEGGSLGDLKEEERGSYGEESFEKRRQEEEGQYRPGGGGDDHKIRP